MTRYVMALTNSPIQFGIWVMAFWFTTNGIFAYLIYPGMFSSHMPETTILFGFVPITLNLCHAICHFVTGVIGLIAVQRASWSAAYAIAGAVYYIAWGIIGLVGGETVRHHLGVDVLGTWVHVVEGCLLALIWVTGRRRHQHRTTAS
jgi:hypothetical protein